VGASWPEKTHRHRCPSRAPCSDRPVEGDQRFALQSVVESRDERSRTRYRACKAFQKQMANDPIAFPRLIQVVSVALPALQSRRHQASRATFSPSRGFAGKRGWGSSSVRSEYPWKRSGSGWTHPRNEHLGMHCPARWRQPRRRPTTPLSERAAAIEHELPATLPTRRCPTRFSVCASTPRTAGSIATRYSQRVRRRLGRCTARHAAPGCNPGHSSFRWLVGCLGRAAAPPTARRRRNTTSAGPLRGVACPATRERDHNGGIIGCQTVIQSQTGSVARGHV